MTGVTITNPGAGYTSAPTITFSGGTVTTAGTNPTGTGNDTNFTPVSYAISNTGSGYTSTPVVTFSNGTSAATMSLSGVVLEGDSSIGGTGDITIDGVVSESGGSRILMKVGSNTLTLSNTGNSFSGGTVINSGTVSIAADNALGTAPASPTPGHLTLNGGTLATTATFELNANRGVSLGGSGGTFDVADATTLGYGGIVADGGSLTKAGTGTLALSGPSSYTGATLVNAGTLSISNNTALGTTTGGVTVASGATLQLSGGITVGNEALSLAGDGAVAGMGALHNLSGTNAWGGTLNVVGGTRINAAAGSLLISGDIVMTGTTPNFNVGGDGDIEISGVIYGGLQFFKSSVGTGTVTLSNPNNTYTNHTTVAAGTLKISTEGNLGTTPASFSSVKLRVRSGGTLQTTADMSISVNRGITISHGGGTISPDTGTTLTVNSVMAGTATDAFVKAGGGRMVMTANNTYAGVTDVTAGSLHVGLAGSGRTGTGIVTAKTGSTILGTGVVRGAAFVAESGSTVHAGDGTAAGDHGTLTFTPASGSGSFDFQSGSSVILGINPGGSGDLLTFDGLSSGSLLFNGNLQVTAFGYTPVSVETFNLLDWANLTTTTFDARYGAGSYGGYLLGNGDDNLGFDLPDISGSGYAWDISAFTTNGTISIVNLVPEPSRVLLLFAGALGFIMRRHRSSTS